MTTLAGEPLLDGRYKLRRRLGQGGMGVVYKARHLFLKTTHAIKVILPDLVGSDAEFLTRFRQEAMAAAAIRHHNVITVTDYGVINNSMPFLVMEFIQGKSLNDILGEKKRLTPEQALEIMQPIGAGVAAAHRRGIVHRDLKPLNIMVEDDLPMYEAIKVLDFGLAKIKSGDLLGSFVAAKTTGMMGSPFYMAPEQWSEEEPDKTADIYSLGILLFEMLAGEVPFKGQNPPAVMKKHLMDAPPRFAELEVDVPSAVEEVVRHALEKNPAQRPETVLDFVNELRDAVNASKPLPDMRATTPYGVRLGQDQLGGTLPAIEPAHGQTDLMSEERRRKEEDSRQWDEAEARRAAIDEARRHEEETETRSPVLSGQEPAGTGAEPPDLSSMTLYASSDVARPSEPSEEGLTVGAGQQGLSGADPSDWQMSQTVIQSAAPVTGPEVGQRSQRWTLIGLTTTAVVLATILAVLIYRSASSRTSHKQSPVPTNTLTSTPPPLSPKSNQSLITGGTYRMGRSDVPANLDSLSKKDQQEFYAQYPAHVVEVNSFYIDKTEVTNADYAECVRAQACVVPHDDLEGSRKQMKFWTPWEGTSPPAGQEKWPVGNVTVQDAETFAAWRSQRDGVQYRLPTEQEWEYAARSGGKAQLYPWGDNWEHDRTNMDTEHAEPVGTYPQGQTEQGVQDMIGNVWEWTSSVASVYEGNRHLDIAKEETNTVVRRGGSFFNRGAVPATFRTWIPPNTRLAGMGFRLVQAVPAP